MRHLTLNDLGNAGIGARVVCYARPALPWAAMLKPCQILIWDLAVAALPECFDVVIERPWQAYAKGKMTLINEAIDAWLELEAPRLSDHRELVDHTVNSIARDMGTSAEAVVLSYFRGED